MEAMTDTQLGLICEALRREIDRLLAGGYSPTGFVIRELKQAYRKALAELDRRGPRPPWVSVLAA